MYTQLAAVYDTWLVLYLLSMLFVSVIILITSMVYKLTYTFDPPHPISYIIIIRLGVLAVLSLCHLLLMLLYIIYRR